MNGTEKNGDAVIEIDDLRVWFPHELGVTRALDGVQLRLLRSQIHAVVGASGSGKSTLAAAILGLLPTEARQTGELLVEGRRVCGLSGSELREVRGGVVGWAFQDPSSTFDPIRRIERQMLETLGLHRGPRGTSSRAEVVERLREVGIPDPDRCIDAYPHELSGGLQQRVSLALALCGDPSFLIADEPTSALDTLNSRKVLTLLHNLAKQRSLGVLLISHDLDVVGQLADEVLVMERGRITERGSWAEVRARGSTPYTVARPISGVATELGQLDKSGHGAAPLLSGDDLSVAYDRSASRWRRSRDIVRALDGVSFELRRGQTLGVIGESGSGKTTLGKVALGLVRPTSGKITFDGAPIFDLKRGDRKRFRRRVQMVLQDPYSTLNPRMTVEQALCEAFAVHHIGGSPAGRREQAATLLVEVGLEAAHLSRYPHELSGGQRQRVGIARALAVAPDLLVCDEPVAQLDVVAAAQILDLLRSLQRTRGVSYLFISHDLRVIAQMAHHILVLLRGQIVERGEAAALLLAPQHDYTRALVGGLPRLDDGKA